MGRYRAADLINPPTLVSLLRLPLAVLFPFVHESVGGSLTVLVLAAVTDIVDGWIARRYGMATATGAVVDGVTDKTFVAAVLATLVLTHKMPASDLVLLGVREIGELPLVVWLSVSPSARRRKIEDKANAFGKAATVLQFAAVIAILVGSGLRHGLLLATVVVGALAALSYWWRALRAKRVDDQEA